MKSKAWMMGLFAVALLLGTASLSAADAPKTHRIDMTGRDNVSEAEIISALMPVKMRGIRKTPATQIGGSIKRRIAMTINFAFDSDQLLPEAIPNLQSLGRALQSPQLSPYRIRIEGHTDNVGNATYNQRLSQRRAKTVKTYLVKHFDIAADNLLIHGRGEADPIDKNTTPEGRQRNRRAEFVNLGK